MEKRLGNFAVTGLMAVAACSFMGIANAQITVALGTDYLETSAIPGPGGTFFQFPMCTGTGPGGSVEFEGVPLAGFGTSDTIVERQEDATFAGPLPSTAAPIPVQVLKLNLISTAPYPTCNLGSGSAVYSIKVTLAPSPASTGTMTITENPPGTNGTYTAVISLNALATFTNTVTGKASKEKAVCVVLHSQGPWASTPAQGTTPFLKTAKDNCTPTLPTPTASHCLGTLDQKANMHKPLAKNTEDFYMVGSVTASVGSQGQHVVCGSSEQSSKGCPAGR